MTPAPFDVVVLSSVEWDAARQRHHAFASQWSAAGHRVFFVENTGFREPGVRDRSRVLARLRAAFASRPGGHAVPRGIEVISPLVLPPTRRAFREANEALLVPRLVDLLHDRGLRAGAVVFAYLPTATTLSLIDQMRASLVVYDCVDNFYGLPSPPADLAAMEGALLARAGLVLTTSRTLHDRLRPRHAAVLEIHHGVGPSFFLPPRAPGPHRRFVYFGTIWSALDYGAIAALANAGFQVDLIGPVKEPPPPLPPSVRLKGPVAHDDLPAVLADADALILPYADNEYNKGVIPAKTYECLATGRPVFASPLPGLTALSELSVLTFARGPEDWSAAARDLDRFETEERRAARVAVAREHEEGRVFARLRAAVDEARRAAPPAAFPPRRATMLSGIAWITVLYGLAKASTLAAQMIAGRWLGPAEYGVANLATAAASYLQIIPMLGFPTALGKLLASETGEERRATFVSTALFGFTAWFLLTLPAMMAAHRFLEQWLGIPSKLFALSLLFASATAFYTVIASPLLGLRRFAHRGLAEGLYGLSAPLLMFAFFLWRGPTHESMVLALSAALLLGAAYALWPLRRYLKLSFEPAAFAGVLRYASVATLNLLAAACILAPARIMLNRHGSPESVGLFSAYFTATVQIALALLYMLQSALVPLASDESGQREGWTAYRRWAAPAGAAAFAFFFVAGAAALAAFGRQYPMNAAWLASFALAAALVLVHGAASALLSARDFNGLCASVAGGLIAGAGNAALVAWLVPAHGVAGAAVAMIASYSAGLAWYGGYAALRGARA